MLCTLTDISPTSSYGVHMKVVLNSDILFQPTLVTRQLSRSLLALFKACTDKGHVIVIPLTSKLEFDRVQSDHAAAEVRQIDTRTFLKTGWVVARGCWIGRGCPGDTGGAGLGS
jgi:hypothetical protein